MNRPYIRRALIVLAILSLVVLSTAAVAHGHFGANAAADESHCPLCMAVHSAKHAVTAPVSGLLFTAMQTAVVVSLTTFSIVLTKGLLTQGRAPPSF
jgi:Protein of unknown function (DUF2946)